MSLVTQVYQFTQAFPQSEMYGLVSQVRRCGVSIPSNIAEGYGRQTTKDYIRFLYISKGSLYELQTQLEICCNIGYAEKRIFGKLCEDCNEIERMLNSMISKLKEKEEQGRGKR